MAERKLTFSETILAIDCCHEPGTSQCKNCPLDNEPAWCMKILFKEARRHLKETRQELERLKGAKK